MDQCMKINSQFTWKNNNTRNNPLLPHSIRGLIIGKSNCGKTTLLLNLLLQPGWLDYNHLYVFGKSLHQREYQILKKGFEAGLSKTQISNIFKNQDHLDDPVQLIEAYSGEAKGEIKAEFYDDCKLVPDPTALNKEEKNLLVLDDCLLEKQNKAEAFYTRGRHNNCDSFYIAQNYFRLPRTTVRENSNLIILFRQDNKNLSHIHADHCTDITFENFKSFCHKVWSSKYNFVTIDLTRPTDQGKYRHNLDQIMSFVDMDNSDKVVADYTATIKKIQQRNENEKTSSLQKHSDLQQAFAPMIAATENQTKHLTTELQKLEPPEQIKLEQDDPRGSILDYYNTKEEVDKYFAIYKNGNQLILGDQAIQVDRDNNIILQDDSKFKGTLGLWEMIMARIPRVQTIPIQDVENYKELAIRTDLINNPNPYNVTGASKPESTTKYAILKGNTVKKGDGVVFLPSDLKSLEEKLSLLLAEFNAGNRAETRNQIVAIVDQLQDKGVIGRSEARDINEYVDSKS